MARTFRWTTALAAVFLPHAAPAFGQGSPELAAMQTGLALASVGRDYANPPQAVAAAPGQYRQSAASIGARALPPAKPFQFAPQRPTISPYLNLYREERSDTLPNYFAFVLPQLRQQEFAYQQQQALANIQQQLHKAQGGPQPAVPGAGAEGIQAHDYHSRFMNTGNYYRGVPLPQPAEGEQ